jgi:hypothetical protein
MLTLFQPRVSRSEPWLKVFEGVSRLQRSRPGHNVRNNLRAFAGNIFFAVVLLTGDLQ